MTLIQCLEVGKSYTMRGCIPIFFQKIIDYNKLNNNEYNLKLKIIEIYMDKLRDLLSDNPEHISINGKAGVENHLKTLKFVELSNADHAVAIYQRALEKLKTCTTKMNTNSSRSHTIVIVQASKNNKLSSLFISESVQKALYMHLNF